MAKQMTVDEIKAEPGKALGQITRQAGKIKRLTARAEKAEKLADARLHGGRKCVPPAEPVPEHAGLSS